MPRRSKSGTEDPKGHGEVGGGAESPPAEPREQVEAPPVVDGVAAGEAESNDPMRPAATAVMAKPPDFGDQKVPMHATVEERDREEMREAKPPLKVRNPLNEAVGSEFYAVSWRGPDWKHPRTGQRFTVSRYYIHQKVAIDFPENEHQMVHDVPVKRDILHAEGIVYVVIGPRDTMTTEDVQAVIEAERKLLADMGAPKGEPDAT